MKYSIRRAATAFLMGLAAVTLVQAEPAISQYNVVWDSPSKDYNGTMPIGNGDLAANVWVEPTGDLIFYVSKSDAWSGGDRMNGPGLMKLGRVRVKLDPPLYADGTTFKQELDLKTGSIRVDASVGQLERSVRFWIDANHPVIHVEIDSSAPCAAEVALESWRAEGKWLISGAQKDTFLPSDGKTIRWYQRNVHSVMDDTLKVQRLEHLMGKYPDPLINRTFGGLLVAEGLKAKDDRTLVTSAPTKRIHLRVHALTEQTETAEAWLTQLEQQRQATEAVPLKEAWSAHLAWWNAFWDRSTIQLTGTKDAETVAQAYHLQRWIQACAGRGAYPIKFNGSLFTVDGLDARWAKPEGIYKGPDYRRWDGAYWWQNTRLVYWPMLYSGDYEMMRPLFKMYLEMLPLLRERTQHYFGHEGVFFVETTQIWGMQRNNDFGLNNKTFTSFCPYTRWEWQGGLELSAMMLDFYQHTLDDAFVKDVLLPITEEVVLFYDQHYPRDNRANGTMVITPAQALETWFMAINPMPEVAGLHVVIDGLLALPENLTADEQRKRWARLNGELPEIPIEVKDGKRCLAPAELYAQRRNGETPELYAVYPYQTHMVGKPDLDAAIEAFNNRNTITGGWSQESVNAAMLGLTEEAQRMVVESATAKNWGGKADNPQCRFPAFWGPNADWIPDQDHGSVFITALQRMLMLTDGATINLLPAWPDDWNATFKLHAPYKTIVEGRVENGKLLDLKVTPESRRKDVVIVEKGANP
jgi:alpha-L-fucosidase 2